MKVAVLATFFMFFLFDFFLFGRAGKAKRSMENQLLCRRAFPYNLLFALPKSHTKSRISGTITHARKR
ncbi:hypothetical protein [Flavobacterium aurantiibacter]|uniref:hypothetical protein n=1 Tax=Flavobacterium aurantiibacter TaxID=2023067 RepID=UPI0010563C14|nr:hypothetical protein [Flavobacterium aurantiibacter]